MTLVIDDQFASQLLQALTAAFNTTFDEVTALSGEYSESFRARSGDQSFVVKVGRGAEARQLREMQCAFARHLRAVEPTLPLAEPLLTATGEQVVAIDIAGEPYFASVDCWVSGSLMSSLEYRGDEFLFELGARVGQMVAASQGFSDARALRTHDWDLRRFDEIIEPLLATVEDSRHLDILRDLLSEFNEVVKPSLESLPQQVLHHDLNDFNVVAALDPEYNWRIAGFIDFGDVLSTARVCEVAITGAYAMLREPEPLRALSCVVAGFSSTCALLEREVDLIFPLAMMRLSMNASTWNYRIKTQGTTPYAVARSQMTWPILEMLASVDRQMVTGLMRLSAGISTPGRDSAFAPIKLFHDSVTIDTISPQFSAPEDLERPRSTAKGEATTIQLGVRFENEEPFSVLAPFAGTLTTLNDTTLVLADDMGRSAQFEGLVAPQNGDVKHGEELGSTNSLRLVLSYSPITSPLPLAISPWSIPMWELRCPDPLALMGHAVEPRDASGDQVTRLRQQVLASSQRAYYKKPMNLVGSRDVWFRDEMGRQYLDAVNNVTHVGHANQHVVEAAYRQMKQLNTNSRFTYSQLATYAERLVATLPDPLEVVFFTCTGSESNDLALRIARQVTGRKDVFVLGGAYHGNTTAVMDISPNRYRGAGGAGKPEATHEFEQPNLYRGSYQYGHANPGLAYAADAKAVLDEQVSRGRPPAAFFAESLMGTAGQVILPEGYLAETFQNIRNAGGLCVSDEVQVGLGRLGTHFWGFETHGVVPDIVTMGKPMGNGHPLSAVVTTREIADAFDNGMKYFNTFAGSPVSCAIGHAVLDVLASENLQENARTVGLYFNDELRKLQAAHESIGDIRGVGLYVGIELVVDKASKTPDRALAYRVSERMRDEGVITYPNGMGDNILKIKPPMTFAKDHVDLFVETLDRVLNEVHR